MVIENRIYMNINTLEDMEFKTKNRGSSCAVGLAAKGAAIKKMKDVSARP
jgi:hypothetical protein